jgi:methyl-accepting chemotaxis protein
MTTAGSTTTTAATTDLEPGAPCAGWSSGLAEQAARLRVVAGTTEGEFLAIGATLQDFYQRGAGISTLASEMMGEVAGDQVSETIGALGTLLDEMGRYVSRAQQETGESSATLRETLELLDRVSGPLTGFRKVDKVLRMLGISTKIESARMGQSAAGFDTLASDVGNLAVQVNLKANVILSRKNELAKAIEQTLVGALRSGSEQYGRVAGILDKTRGSLGTLTTLNERCTSAASSITAVTGEVSRNMGEVVMSMQAHDMVRQQIEHVDQTLTELAAGLAAGRVEAGEVALVCGMQMAQLRNAADELERAVQAIIGNLREVALKQHGLSRETSSMAGIADQAGGGFLTGMQQDISVVCAALLESSKSNQRLCAAMGSVAETVGEIALFVEDIETIGEEIKLIALNAQIKSAYAGDEGAALGVLAEAIQRLSIDAIGHTTAVTGTLQAIDGVTRRLNGGLCGESASVEAEVHCMVARLGTMLDLLRGVNEALFRSLTGMDGEVARLSRDIDQVTSGITVHHQVSRELELVVLELELITTSAHAIAPAAARDANLAELAGRYTMQSERMIHSALLGAVEPEQAPSEAEFEDNVELF